MSFPRSTELQNAILKEIQALGGKAKLSDLYSRLTKRFPQLTKEDLNRRTPSGANWWTGYIRFGLDALKKNGKVVWLAPGVWGINNLPPPPQARALSGSEEEFHSLQITFESGWKASIIVPVNITNTDVERVRKVLLSLVQD